MAKSFVFMLEVAVLVAVMTQRAEATELWTATEGVALRQDSSDDGPRWLLLVGLKNEADAARLICLGGWSYTYVDEEGPRTGTQGGIHSCRNKRGFTLVLSGETTFVQVPLDHLGLANDNVGLTIRMNLYESRASSDDALGATPFQIDWTDSLAEAVRAGRRLIK